MAIVVAFDLTQSPAGNQSARITAADMAQSQAQMRAEVAQAHAEMMRAQAELRMAQVEADRAQAEAARARAEAGRAQRPGIIVNSRPSVPASRREQAMFFTGFIVVVLAAVAILHPIARAIGRRLEGGVRREPRLDPDHTAQLQRIEQGMEAMAIEIERLSEGQRFTTRLLASRADSESLIPRS